MTSRPIAIVLAATCLSGCASDDRLRGEIGKIEARVAALETQVAAGTEQIGKPGKDVRVRVSYRPLIAWATAFAARPEDQRTISFRQTERDGDLFRQSHRCVFFGEKRDGIRAWIDEADSTRMALAINDLAVEPQDDGLVLRSRLDIDAKTQVAGNYRLRCQPSSVGGTIGVTAKANPATVFRLILATAPGGMPTYHVRVVSPDHVGMEMRANFDWFRVGFTIPIDLPGTDLASGDLDLMFSRAGTIAWPGGGTRTYSLALVDPAVLTDKRGISFASDVEMKLDAPPPAAAGS